MAGSAGGEASQATSARVELELEDLCLQADMFDADSPHVRRLAVSVRGIELRDCGLKPDASPAWHRIFSQHISPRNPRGPSACLLTVSSIPGTVHLEPAPSCGCRLHGWELCLSHGLSHGAC